MVILLRVKSKNSNACVFTQYPDFKCNRIKNLEESSYADASHFQLKLILCYTFFSLSNVLSNIMLLIAIVK